MSVAFLPIYIRLLGIEAYGIIGIYSTLLVVLAVFDLGLPQAITRELAKSINGKSAHQERGNMVRTIELIYWVTAILVGVVVALLAPLITGQWLKPTDLSPEEVVNALRLIALNIFLRWPNAFYLGALNGLNRQFQVNCIQGVMATLQGVGAVAALYYIEASIFTFFISQAMWTVLGVAWLRLSLWSTLGNASDACFRLSALGSIWRFAAGVTSISMLSALLSQLDKIVLSKMLSLNDFGYYTFAASVASVALKLISPVYVAYYPKITTLASERSDKSLAKIYHQGCQVMNFVTLPIGITTLLYSHEILLFWTQNSELSKNAALPLSILFLGHLINGAVHIPYGLQLAHGWTQLALIQSGIGAAFAVPLIYFLSQNWGAIGAASSWVLINLMFLVFGTAVMHRRLLKGDFRIWLLQDFLLPWSAALIAALVYKSLIPVSLSSVGVVLYCMGSVIFTGIFLMISSDQLRALVVRFCDGVRNFILK